jgi:hypothetical protein
VGEAFEPGNELSSTIPHYAVLFDPGALTRLPSKGTISLLGFSSQPVRGSRGIVSPLVLWESADEAGTGLHTRRPTTDKLLGTEEMRSLTHARIA